MNEPLENLALCMVWTTFRLLRLARGSFSVPPDARREEKLTGPQCRLFLECGWHSSKGAFGHFFVGADRD